MLPIIHLFFIPGISFIYTLQSLYTLQEISHPFTCLIILSANIITEFFCLRSDSFISRFQATPFTCLLNPLIFIEC